MPRGHVQETLAAIWSDVLGVLPEHIGVDDNFFSLGGHSLRVTRMNAKIHKTFGIKLPLASVFKNPTIRFLSDLIRHRSETVYQSITAVEKKEYYPQSSAQKRLFFLDRFEDIGVSYNMSSVYMFNGPLEQERYLSAFRGVMNRHAALRTSFVFVDDQPVQVIHDNIEPEVEFFHPDTTPDKAPQEDEAVQAAIRDFIRPFDLSKAPLFRIGFITLSSASSSNDSSTGGYIMVFDWHHIVGDGTSMGVLVNDFIRGYSGEPLSEQPIQYHDFSVWQNGLFETGGIRSQEDYWLERFSEGIPKLNLPSDMARPAIFTFAGDSYSFGFNRRGCSRDLNAWADNTTSPFL